MKKTGKRGIALAMALLLAYSSVMDYSVIAHAEENTYSQADTITESAPLTVSDNNAGIATDGGTENADIEGSNGALDNAGIMLLNSNDVIDISTLDPQSINFGFEYSDYIVINSDNVSDFDGKTLTGTTTSGIFIDNDTTVSLTIEDLNITKSQDICSCISVGYGATLNLTVKGDNTLTAKGWGGAGIEVMGQTKATLRITADSTGTLTAQGGYGSSLYGSWGGAGIGGMARITSDIKQVYVGDIIIEGGTINAKGGYQAAGIGGTIGSSGSNIAITGGTVTATGGSYAAGIGGGSTGNVDSIVITGGTVTATGGKDGAAIGVGYCGATKTEYVFSFGDIRITGGTVTANGNIGYGAFYNENHISGGTGTVFISEDVDISLNGDTKLGSNDATSSRKYTLHFTVYDGRFTADTTAKILLGGKVVAEEAAATLSHNGKVEGDATFLSTNSLAGEKAFTFTIDNRTYTGTVTIPNESYINIETGTPLYPVTLEFYNGAITSDLAVSAITIRQDNSVLSEEKYYAAKNITFQKYGYGTMLLYLPANSDTTEISVTADRLNGGTPITKSGLTILAEGDNTITLLETENLLLSVTPKIYGASVKLRMETNKKVDGLHYWYRQSETELTTLEEVKTGGSEKTGSDGYAEVTISDLESNKSYDYYFVAVTDDGTSVSNVVHITVTTEMEAEVIAADGTSTPYATIDEAFAAAANVDGCTVKLLSNVLLDGAKWIGGTFTIDLNGKEVTSEKTWRQISTNGYFNIVGSITIKDSIGTGRIVGEGGYYGLIQGNSGSLTILNGTFESTNNNNDEGHGYTMRGTTYSNLTIKGGTFIRGWCCAMDLYGLKSDDNSVKLTGGKFYGGFQVNDKHSGYAYSDHILESGYAYKYLSGDNTGKLTTGHVGTADVEVVPAILKGSLTVTAEDLTTGSTLTAVFAPDTDEWVNGDIGAYTYTWYRVSESGDVQLQASQTATNSTSDTYTLTEDDLHSQIYCVVKSGKCGNDVTSHEITVPGQSVSPAVVTLSADSLPYNGTAQTPAVTVVLDGKTLTENTDYTVFYRSNKNAGTATVEIRGEGKYEGLTSRTFTITRKAVTVSGITVQEKIYDGDTAAVLNFDNVMFDGMADGDSLTVTAAGTFSDGNVGENKTVTITGLTLDGRSADNYVLADSGHQTTAAAGIQPRAVLLTWGGNTTLTYNGREQTVTASVSNAVGNDSFTLSYENNGTTTNRATEAGSYTATVTGLGNDNYTLDGAVNRSQDWSIRYLTAEDATLSGTAGNNGWYLDTVTLTPPEGYEISEDKNIWQDTLMFHTEGTQTAGYYLKDGNGGITDAKSVEVKIDTTAPTGEIKIKENSFTSFLNTITFGYFFKETVKVSITGADAVSGVASIEYQKVADEGSYDAAGPWTAGSSFTIEPEEKGIVYARITDHAGRRTILNSEGLVVYTDVAAVSNVSFARMSTDDVDAGIALNGNTVASIVKDGNTLPDGSYTVTQDRLLLKAAYLNTLAVGTYTLTVSYHPLGETFTAGTSRGEAPQTTTITLIVKKGELTVETAPVLSGIYGTTVEDLTVNAENARVVNVSGTEVSGTWSITDTNRTAVPGVGGNTACELTFTPEESVAELYNAVTCMAVPDIRRKPVSVTIANAARKFGEANPEFTYALAEGSTLAGGDTLSQLAITTSTGASEASNVGEYAITGTSGNENYEVTFTNGTLTVTKASAPKEIRENSSSTYTTGSHGSSIIVDVAGKLPVDKGRTGYSVSVADADGILEELPTVDAEGNLAYRVKANTTVGQTAVITVTATMQNYEDATYTLTISIVDKTIVEEKNGSGVAIRGNNTLIYGQKLSELSLEEASFAAQGTDTAVAGTLAWKDPDEIPAAGTTTATWVFTPADSDQYQELEGTVTIRVEKATPVLTAPTVTAAVYSRTATLEKDFPLTGGSARHTAGGTETSVAGSFGWQNGMIVPTVDNTGYIAVFTPTDTANYNSAAVTVNVTIEKAVPTIRTNPTAAWLTYGQALSDSTLSGGEADTAGSFAWADGSTKPSVADSDRTEYGVIFTPADEVNYTTADCYIRIVVNKAENAPGMPGRERNVAYDVKKVGEVSLSDSPGWVWQDSDIQKTLEAGKTVTATAVYVGSEKGNYKNESVTVSITRSECGHAGTKVENAKAATCQSEGYTGDTYCTECGALLSSGTTIPKTEHTVGTAADCRRQAVCGVCGEAFGALDGTNHEETELRNYRKPTCMESGYSGDTYCRACNTLISSGKPTAAAGHIWDNGTVSKEPTATAEGERTYTCIVCGAAKTESIAKTGGAPEAGQPLIKGDNGSIGWDVIRSLIDGAKDGGTVRIDMNGSVVVPKAVFESMKDRDVNVVFYMDDPVTWTVNGRSITKIVGDINLGVSCGKDEASVIPVDIINNVTGERYSINLTLAYDGEFGFTAVLTIQLDRKNAGLYADLYYYNEQTGELELMGSDQIDADGNAELTFTHASDYLIVIDSRSPEDTGDNTAGDATENTVENTSGSAVKAPKTGEEWHLSWYDILIGALVIAAACGLIGFRIRRKKK